MFRDRLYKNEQRDITRQVLLLVSNPRLTVCVSDRITRITSYYTVLKICFFFSRDPLRVRAEL